MPYYRLYCINDAGHFFHCDSFEADSDALAVEKALKLQGAFAAELWQAGRMVHTFVKRTSEAAE